MNENSYPIYKGIPLLLPTKLHRYFCNGFIQISGSDLDDSLLLYYKIWSLKNKIAEENPEHILPQKNEFWKKKQYESVRSFVKTEGTVLEIGCGDPEYSRIRLGSPKKYFGIDSFYNGSSKNYALGVVEYLPIADESFETVTILGVLDHVLDYVKVID